MKKPDFYAKAAEAFLDQAAANIPHHDDPVVGVAAQKLVQAQVEALLAIASAIENLAFATAQGRDRG